jgi:hypothetical protein
LNKKNINNDFSYNDRYNRNDLLYRNHQPVHQQIQHFTGCRHPLFMPILKGFHFEIPKCYINYALFFSVMVEMVNMKVSKKEKTAE